jgi:hypothetical protein
MNVKEFIRYSPWIAGRIDILNKRLRGIRRTNMMLYVLDKVENTDKNVILTGPRRTGKTTTIYWTIRRLLEKVKEPKSILFFNFDDYEVSIKDVIEFYFENILETDPATVVSKVFIFLDEIQYIKNWSRYVKKYSDMNKNIRFIVSGSSPNDLLKNARRDLAGRKIEIMFYPIKFSEYLLHKVEKDRMNGSMIISARKEFVKFLAKPDVKKIYEFLSSLRQSHLLYESLIRSKLEEYMVYGGYPSIIFEKNDATLFRDLLLEVKEKDTRIRKSYFDFIRFLSVLAEKEINEKNLSSLMVGETKPTIKAWLEKLQESYIVQRLNSFSYSTKREMEKSRDKFKIYFIDRGMRNALVNSFLLDDSLRDDEKLLENNAEALVFDALRCIVYKLGYDPDKSIFYYKKKTGKKIKAEIDFIVNIKNRNFIVECKYGEVTNEDIRKLANCPIKSSLRLIISKSQLSLMQNVLVLPLWLFLLCL